MRIFLELVSSFDAKGPGAVGVLWDSCPLPSSGCWLGECPSPIPQEKGHFLLALFIPDSKTRKSLVRDERARALASASSLPHLFLIDPEVVSGCLSPSVLRECSRETKKEELSERICLCRATKDLAVCSY